MINYIILMVLFQTLFLAVYDLFLQKETFFKWNRIYLLVTPILSFIIPLLRFESIQKSVPQEYIEYLPEVVINPQVYIEKSTSFETGFNVLPIIFYAGLTLFTVLFLVRLIKILKLIHTGKSIKKDDYTLIVLNKKQSAFSFFNYIFINNHLLEKQDLQIIQHELIHCKHRHTLDLLYFELLKIALWFNPMVYVYQKRITLLHEYISDAEVVKETDKAQYFNKLLAETFNVENISFINQFFKHSLIKKRIVMITKEKSQKMKQLKYLLIAPLLLGMMFYVSCVNDAQADFEEIENVLQKGEVNSEGKYFESKNGLKIFTGSYLAGKVVPFEEYTEKEKEIFNSFQNIKDRNVSYSIVIDSNGDRVQFIQTDSKYKANETIEIENGDEIAFSRIENVPVFPGCEGTEEELRACLQDEISAHVNANFNSEMAKGLGLETGVKKIFVMFKIDKDGNIAEVKSRAPHQSLADEAIRVIESLPKMIPGKQKGEAVGVKYSLPIVFNVEGRKQNVEKTKFNDLDSKVFPLIIFEGKEISKEEMQKIKPENIKSMEVLKGESAIEKYGDKGKDGIIIITKKQ
ncbi:MAG: M56 family metallopeptidase [Lutibacter sp.]|nr:M56 family metallopeptidase [Lutibacter sp.]